MVYVHVPFCRSFCIYCDFYSRLCPRGDAGRVDISRYVRAVCAEAAERRDEIALSAGVRTLYFGGGTPSLLTVSDIASIVHAVDMGPYDEFTVEVNPDDIVDRGPSYVEGLLELGVNRISMGVQSLDDAVLRWMHRRHDAAGARKAFGILRSAGVDNVSLDIIFGLPQLGEGDLWERTVDAFLELGPEHLSAYALSVEEGSRLGKERREGRFLEPPQEQVREQYDLICGRLASAGYHHYEISNFALPGREAQHNSAYWRRVPYVGLGPAAHSFDGRRRSFNTTRLEGYTRRSELLSPEDAARECLMLSLRTDAGLPESELVASADTQAVARHFTAGSLVRTPEGRVRIPESRFFVSDDIISDLFR